MNQVYERNIMKKNNFSFIAGIDEAGRGPLAGPVVAAAVILPRDFDGLEITDSKKLSPRKREEYFFHITSNPNVFYGISAISAKRIDEINILNATYEAMKSAVSQLSPPPEFCLIDGLPVPHFPFSSKSIVKGDSKVLSIAAASILAKVFRDGEMLKYDIEFPEYGFARHKGYGTSFHFEALKKYGSCRIHRKTFQPVAKSAFSA